MKTMIENNDTMKFMEDFVGSRTATKDGNMLTQGIGAAIQAPVDSIGWI